MKIKYGHRQKRTGNIGTGAVFDFDWEITIIDKTTRPHKKKTISRTDMIGNTLSVIKDIDNYIEYNFCVGITKYWDSDINKQHRKKVGIDDRVYTI